MQELTTKIDYELQAKNYLQAKNIKLDSNELQQFILMSQAYGLNPFKNEIYAVKYNTKYKNERTGEWFLKSNFNVVVSYQIILSVATRHADYGGVEIEYYSGNQPILRFTKDTPDLWAIIKIYKYVNGNRLLNNTSRIDYANDYKQQRNNKFAQDYFTAWCEKLAYVSIIRKTYPTETQGMYLADEFATNVEKEQSVAPALEESKQNLFQEAKEYLESKVSNSEEAQEVLKSYFTTTNTTLKEFKKGIVDMEVFKEVVKQFNEAKLYAMHPELQKGVNNETKESN